MRASAFIRLAKVFCNLANALKTHLELPLCLWNAPMAGVRHHTQGREVTVMKCKQCGMPVRPVSQIGGRCLACCFKQIEETELRMMCKSIQPIRNGKDQRPCDILRAAVS